MAPNTVEEHVSRDDAYRTQYDPADPDGVSAAIVGATAAVAGTSPTRLEPLSEVIDTDALEASVRSAEGSAVVEFVYHGHGVAVCSDGNVVVTDTR